MRAGEDYSMIAYFVKDCGCLMKLPQNSDELN